MRRFITALFVLSLVAAGCGDDDPVADGEDLSGVDADLDVIDSSGDASEADGALGTEADDVEGTGTAGAGDEDVPTGNPAEPPPADREHDDEHGDPLVFAGDLAGNAEVPGPGDDGATGRVEIESDIDGRLCFDMVATGLDAAVTGAHIHEAAAGEAGDVVISIGPPTSSDEGSDAWVDVCLDVAAEVVDAMAARPSDFYANVHTETYGAGAVRGQLETATIFDLTLR